MFRDYLFDSSSSSYSSQAADGTIQLSIGFQRTDVKKFPRYPLKTGQALLSAAVCAAIFSLILVAVNIITKKRSKSSDTSSDTAQPVQGVGSLYLAVFIDSFGAFMMLPYLGILAIMLGCDAFGASCLGAIFAFMQFIGTGILHVLADVYNKKLILLWTLGMCSLCIFASGFAVLLPTGNHKELLPNPDLTDTETADCMAGKASQSGHCYTEQLVVTGINFAYMLLLLCRAVAGFFASTVSIAQALVAERSTEETRTGNISMVMAFFALGIVAGPFIGGIVFDYGYENLCYCSGAITLVNVFYTKVQLVVDTPALAGSKAAEKETNDKDASGQLSVAGALWFLFSDPLTSVLLLATFFATAAPALWTTAASFLYIGFYAWSGIQLGLFFAAGGFVGFLAMGMLAQPAATYYGDSGSVIVGSLIRAICYFLFNIRVGWVAFILFPILMATNAMIDGQLQSLMTTVSPPGFVSTAIGVMQMLRSLGEALLPPVAGWLVEMSYWTPFTISSAMAVACMAIVMPHYRNIGKIGI